MDGPLSLETSLIDSWSLNQSSISRDFWKITSETKNFKCYLLLLSIEHLFFRKYLILGFHAFGVIFLQKNYSIASNSITEVSGAQNNMFVCPPRNLFFVSEVLKQFFYDPSQKSRFWIPPFVTSCNFLFNTFSD